MLADIYKGVHVFWGRELGAHWTEIPQCADTLLEQQHGQTEEPNEPQKRALVSECMRREAVAVTVGSVEDHYKQPQPKPVVHKHFCS